MIDVLKQEIQTLANKNEKLNETILTQNKTIADFQTLIVDISSKLMNHYKGQTAQLVQLNSEKVIYQQLLFLKYPTISHSEQSGDQTQNQIACDSGKDKDKSISTEGSSGSESEDSN
jgi:hypothetical protein